VSTILVLDDIMDAAIMVQRLLERKGHQVHIFNDEDHALRFVDANPALDLVILDMKLRKMDGLEVVQEIKKKRPGLPVIILTGYPTPESEQRAYDLGVVAFCAKPVDKTILEEKVALALGHKEAR